MLSRRVFFSAKDLGHFEEWAIGFRSVGQDLLQRKA